MTAPRSFVRWAGLAVLIAALLVPQAGSLRAEANPIPSSAASSTAWLAQAVAIESVPSVALEAPAGNGIAYPRLESQLAQLYRSAVLSSGRPLETFAGQPHIDLVAGTARVILEMDIDPQAHQTGPARLEQVVLEDRRTATIEHAPPTAVRAGLATALTEAGATFELGVGDLVQVLAPFGSLKALSEITGVRVVRLPFPAQTQELLAQAAGDSAPQAGTYTTEGRALTGADWANAAGYDGTGVKLAVFDFGFTNWAARQTSGDLPSGGNLVNKDFSSAFDFAGNTADYDHGTACAEIAYDMAPGSTVYLYAFGTDAEFATAVDDYSNNISGHRVASMSINWVNAGPYDGTGNTSTGPTTKVTQARDAGIFWANAAGNFRSQHYSWTSARYGTTNYVAFGSSNVEGIGSTPGSLWPISSGTVLRIYLEWNDWNDARTGDQSNIDYNIELHRWTGSAWTLVTGSYGNQCGASVTPTEAIAYTVPNGGPYYYGLLILRNTACANNFGHWMELFTFNGFSTSGTGMVPSFWYGNACNSLAIPSDADGAVCTGATFWGEDGNPTYNYGLETFSSLGPRNDVGGANPGTTVNKPDVVGPDMVSTVLYPSNGLPYRTSGHTGFGGTSAATPHVAGLAASLWEQYSSDSLAQLRTKLQSYALCKGTGGTCGTSGACTPQLGGTIPGGPTWIQSTLQNNVFGWGRISYWDPTSVRLKRFQAWPEGSAIHVQWETSQELDNLGFNLYRAATRNGVKTKLNLDLIPTKVPPGSPFGAVYDWIDSRVRPGRTFFYWLEDVDLQGQTTLHGPVRIRLP